ncbi:unnamed protein product [Pedinophyceae sp. YPF-701]|nr:unnamed protein product [Pedinophyceae sp. YPF-701]
MLGLGLRRLPAATARQAARTVARAASSSSPQVDPFKLAADLLARADQVRDVGFEAFELAVQTGPRRAANRSLKAAVALSELGAELAGTGTLPTQAELPALLRRLFEKLGTTYIKLGQFIASSPTIFPEEYVLEFQKCLDQTEPVPYETIRAIVREELGRPLEEVFEYIDPRPLASASVAQVHAAVLKGSGQDVVLKVLKPGVEDVLQVDLNFLYVAARALEIVAPELSRTSVGSIVQDIRTSMLDEVDFRKEAQHIGDFASFLNASGMRQVATCPEVYRQFSTRRLLVLERLYGVALTDLNAIRSITTADPETVLISALNTWFGSVIGCSTFHADVHAGNLLVLKDGRVGFIDFGIVGRISPGTWNAVQALLTSTASGDYTTMAKALVTLGATDANVNIPAFARDLEELFTQIEDMDSQIVVTASEGPGGDVSMGASVAVDDAQMNRLILDVVRVGEVHGLRFPREFGLLLKQLLYFDRYIRILAPEMQVLSDSRVKLSRSPFATMD